MTIRVSRRGLVTSAAFSLAMFVLGAAVDFAHHLVDPTCANERANSSRPCASCSMVHGGALTEGAVTMAPTMALRPATPCTPATIACLVADLSPSAPRAPPLA